MSDRLEIIAEGRGVKRYFVGGAIAWLLLIFAANNSPIHEFIEERFSQSVNFNLRERLHLTPPLSPKLKILALDEGTFAMLGGPQPSIPDWVKLFENIGRQNPRAILVDKLFSEPPAADPAVEEALASLRQVGIPIYTGLFLSPREIKHRAKLPLAQQSYQLSHYLGANYRARHGELPRLEERFGWQVYGSAAGFEGVFRGQGHIVFTSTLMAAPFYWIAEDLVVPHLALYSAGNLAFSRQQILVDGEPVPLNGAGRVLLNHRPPLQFYGITKSLRFALQRARAGEPEAQIEADDVVLILATFQTGNTDFVEGGPFGQTPGGFLVASLIDSVLSHRWLHPFGRDNVILALLCLLGFLVGTFTGPLQFWYASVGIAASFFAFVIYLFCYGSVVVPWAIPLAGFFGVGLIQYGYKNAENELRRLLLQKDYFAEKALRLEEENKKVVLEQSLALGKVVQDLLLPKQPFYDFSQFHLETIYNPSQKMGGDWLYVWEYSSGEKRVIIGDVMGKGPSAAIPVAIIIGTLRDCEDRGLSMEAAIESLNRRFVDLFGKQITTTLAAVVLHGSGEVDFYNAGSPGWFLTSSEGSELLFLRSNPVGLTREFRPARVRHGVKTGGLFFTFTDGYLEGSRAVKRLVRRLQPAMAEGVSAGGIHELLMEVGEGNRLEDDRTLLTVKVGAKSSARAS